MITQLLSKIIGSANDRKVRQLQAIVKKINAFEPAISALTNDELFAKLIISVSNWQKAKRSTIFCRRHLPLCVKLQNENLANATMMCS
jgi:preprotein translocase subunit SecA